MEMLFGYSIFGEDHAPLFGSQKSGQIITTFSHRLVTDKNGGDQDQGSVPQNPVIIQV